MKIPNRLQDLLPTEAVKQLVDLVAQPQLVQGLKEAAQKIGLGDAWQPSQLQDAVQQAKRWVESVSNRFRSSHASTRQGINATGHVFSEQWCTIPWDDRTVQAVMQIVSGFATSSHIADSVRNKVVEISGATDVLVLPSLSMAVQLLSSHPKWTEGFVVPRCDFVRLEGRNDVGTLLSSQGRVVREVGASNSCSMEDIENTLIGSTQAVMTCWPNSMPHDDEALSLKNNAVKLANRMQTCCIEILSTGSLIDLSTIGIRVPCLSDRIGLGVKIAVIPGNGLIGGPRCGLLIGDSHWIKPLREKANQWGWNADAVTLVGLDAALDANRDLSTWKSSALGLILSNNLDNLEGRAKRMATQLSGCAKIKNVQMETRSVSIGSGLWSNITLPSPILAIEPIKESVQDLAQALSIRDLPIWTNAQSHTLECVVRTIDPADDQNLIQSFENETPTGSK